MEAAFFAIVVIVAIVRGLYRFFRWVARSLRGLSSPGGTGASPQPMPARAPAPAPERGRPSPMPLPPVAAPREATAVGSREQEKRPIAAEPQPMVALSEGAPPRPTAPKPLFGDTPDLVRALILQEVLGPPLSKRSRSA